MKEWQRRSIYLAYKSQFTALNNALRAGATVGTRLERRVTNASEHDICGVGKYAMRKMRRGNGKISVMVVALREWRIEYVWKLRAVEKCYGGYSYSSRSAVQRMCNSCCLLLISKKSLRTMIKMIMYNYLKLFIWNNNRTCIHTGL